MLILKVSIYEHVDIQLPGGEQVRVFVKESGYPSFARLGFVAPRHIAIVRSDAKDKAPRETSSQVESLLAHLRAALVIHQHFDPKVEDTAAHLPITLQHQFDRDRAHLRQMINQFECFGELVYSPDKTEIETQ